MIKLIANYSKRLGLPGYSSHQFSVSVETELVKTDDVPAEAGRLYELLQNQVDEQIVTTGFVPPADYGMAEHPSLRNADVPDDSHTSQPWRRGPAWKCSDKQKELILNIVEENQLDKNKVESLAKERFGKGVRSLGKKEASSLIDELLGSHASFGHSEGAYRTHGPASAGGRGNP
jgi:hypothetical protein